MVDITFTDKGSSCQEILLATGVNARSVEQFLGYQMSRSWGRSVWLFLEIRADVHDKSTQGYRLRAEDMTS